MTLSGSEDAVAAQQEHRVAKEELLRYLMFDKVRDYDTFGTGLNWWFSPDKTYLLVKPGGGYRPQSIRFALKFCPFSAADFGQSQSLSSTKEVFSCKSKVSESCLTIWWRLLPGLAPTLVKNLIFLHEHGLLKTESLTNALGLDFADLRFFWSGLQFQPQRLQDRSTNLDSSRKSIYDIEFKSNAMVEAARLGVTPKYWSPHFNREVQLTRSTLPVLLRDAGLLHSVGHALQVLNIEAQLSLGNPSNSFYSLRAENVAAIQKKTEPDAILLPLDFIQYATDGLNFNSPSGTETSESSEEGSKVVENRDSVQGGVGTMTVKEIQTIVSPERTKEIEDSILTHKPKSIRAPGSPSADPYNEDSSHELRSKNLYLESAMQYSIVRDPEQVLAGRNSFPAIVGKFLASEPSLTVKEIQAKIWDDATKGWLSCDSRIEIVRD
jgi:hypothetical protein